VTDLELFFMKFMGKLLHLKLFGKEEDPEKKLTSIIEELVKDFKHLYDCKDEKVKSMIREQIDKIYNTGRYDVEHDASAVLLYHLIWNTKNDPWYFLRG
jgi:hypothetical protein